MTAIYSIMSRFSLLQAALAIRFFSYIGLNIMNIVMPLAIYQLTGKMSLAGLSLLLEWLPKLTVYIYSGQMVRKWGLGKLLGFFMLFRLISMAFVFLALHQLMPWWAITLAAIAYQTNSAFFNLSYELNMSRWTSCSPSGHTKTLAGDNWAGVIGAGIGLFIHNLSILTGIAVAFLMIAVWLQRYWQDALFDEKFQTPVEQHRPATFLGGALEPFSELKNISTPLWLLTGIAVLMTMTPAIVFPVMPFFLDHAFGYKVDTQMFSAANLIRISLSAVVLQMSLKLIDKYGPKAVFAGAVTASFAILVSLVFLKSYLFVGLILFMGAVNFCMYPWVRGVRQEIMPKSACGPTLTGLLSALSNFSYVLAGLVIALGLTAKSLLLICAFCMLGAFILFKTLDYKYLKRFKKV